MLNQFYKYLSEKLINYFNQCTLQGGERFYLQFDNKEQVNAFYEFLKGDVTSNAFRYQHHEGSPYYTTFALQQPGSIKIVVAATTENVTPDFLVTLRNQVGEQKKEWSGTALLSICHETLDSIRGGSSDLQKEGMPLNVKSILKTLKEEIEKNSLLTLDHKEILQFHLRKKLDESYIQSSLWDYEEILSFLSQGKINEKDYSHLGLFYDKNLDQYSQSQMKKRLEENYSLFEQIQHIHEYDNLQNQLEKSFTDKGVIALKKENWFELDFGFVKESFDNSDEKPLIYIENAKRKSTEGLIFWDKPNKDTKAGQRKRHLIVFNPTKLIKLNLAFEFNERLKKEFIHDKSKDLCTVSGKRLVMSLSHEPNSTSFHQVVYTHNNKSKSKYVFNVAIVECDPDFLREIKTLYEVNSKTKKIILNKKDEMITFGDTNVGMKEIFVEEENQVITESNQGIEISNASSAWNDDNLYFQMQKNGALIPLNIKEETSRVTPITGNRIWKLKREQLDDFHYDVENNTLKQNTLEFSAREEIKLYLLDEIEWVGKELFHAKREVTGLEGLSLDLNVEIEQAYNELLGYYKSRNLLPSLSYMNEELFDLSFKYVNSFIELISGIQENVILAEQSKNLFKLGTIIEEDKISFTPLHPLNVAYQLEINKRLKNEPIELHILDRLHPNNLLPYIYGEDKEIYRPINQKDAPEWMIYEPIQKVAIGESNAFLANVVEEKLNQFVQHFPFLFLKQSKSPIQINVINVSNDHEVVRGLINFIKKQIDKKGASEIVPIEVALYDDKASVSAFEKFSMNDDVEEFEATFNVSLTTKKLDAVDVLRLIRENVLYYKPLNVNEYGYAHISFYKMISNDSPAKNKIQDIDTGLSLKGLLSSISFLETEKDYRTGFGLKNAEHQTNELISIAICLNELASNLDSGGTNPYRKDETIVTRTANYDEDILNQLYDTSYWVTFIEPNVDLNFFQSASRNLLVIHYSDQYSSSTQYDAITVTDKSAQYKLIIEQYLAGKEINTKSYQIETAIRGFNSLNGEWLLRIIGSKGHFSREKVSIISAIRYILSTLDHENILWVPISLEEVLRIAGAVRLTKSEGVFSAKNLNVKGMHSDDLLLIGIETRGEDTFVHYYPVEVKIGINQESTIVKAKEQINKTQQLFKTQLAKYNEDDHALFKNEFFRNFFIQLLLSNAEKLIDNNIWPEKDYSRIHSLKEKLLNDDYLLSNHLQPFIGKGAVLSFKKEQTWRSVRMDDDILVVDLTEDDGYSGVITEIETIKGNIRGAKTDIKPESLLFHKYRFKIVDPTEPLSEGGTGITGIEPPKLEPKPEPEPEPEPVIVDPSIPHIPELKDVRVLLGTVEGSAKEVYWEYGHSELANRHILISGKSGQGKSYFIQCLLLELSRSGISNIIFDYTDGFKNSKLEPQFKEQLSGSLEQFLVARDKFPINPFKRNQKELDEDEYMDEDNTDIAERIKGVFSSVYKDLGIQQQNAIYEAVLRGLDKYGDSMNLELLLVELGEDNTGPAKTARSQIKPLIDKNPFKSDGEYNWQEILSQKGKVFIVQLTGYNRDVQMMITEFILWDLWNYQLNHGDKTKPLAVILDEAQNLDHREKSPSAKILSEGRKFGWSGWYATQSFRGQFTIDEISRLQGSSQKVYFMPPENEISSIAANLAQDSHARKEWERKLSTLKKGQCVVSGPMLQDDGTLKHSMPIVIDISSLDERLE
ncbi:DNA phosphorothioation-dependent restriction protein DptH [Peribacillus frigoritolerans]|uniref:DNA phosphorothioation-dependent restriction protein DptH n=1 Tax=Peribacillus frigoritolerans TaxID=450367 RepID=UPI0022825208|nr:DNA phosphorothioation-dependent restriction protein DptH [Peribacillus frigoritolerans]MCY9138069.1 DNA phosphorothioation-dependent restriction protein DptH [Peribacillus frigoritolerans]